MTANDNPIKRTGFAYLWRQIRLLCCTLLVMAAIKMLPRGANSIAIAEAFGKLADALRKAI